MSIGNEQLANKVVLEVGGGREKTPTRSPGRSQETGSDSKGRPVYMIFFKSPEN
jgi:hypothetical protein